ncbi:hypothetical protein KAS08_00060 [Candidatus Pacearchaeota archaeon]|nr:hypothetical protein [Candidatus Pacearchaeota archaeon]
MDINDEIKKNVLELEKREFSMKQIEEIFNGYNDPNLIKLGYKENIDYAIEDIIVGDLKSKEAITHMYEILNYWSEDLVEAGTYQKNIPTPRKKLGELEKSIILQKSGISKKNINNIFNDCKTLEEFNFEDVIEDIVTHLKKHKLKGRKATNYIEKKVGEWGELFYDDNDEESEDFFF